jgi:glucose/arabinose dehydrogenase
VLETLLRLVAAVSVALVAAGAAGAYSFEPIATGFDQPVYVTTAPGDPSTLYVVERKGTIEIVRGGQAAGTFLDITNAVWSGGEGGLLSIAFHPRYAENHLFYIDYTDLDRDTHIVEYTSANGVAVPSSARELLFVEQTYENHKGGQLQFDKQGRLYVGMGDGGSNPDSLRNDPDNRAQDLGTRLGKLLRIDPTASSTWQMIGYGLRNPWRFSFDRLTGDLWLGDVGAGVNEELDFRPRTQLGAPANFGWSHFEGTVVYNGDVKLRGNGRLVAPVWVYTHSRGNCSVVGGYVYRGARLPKARGRYFFGDYCTGVIWSFKVGPKGRASAVTRLADHVPNLVSFGEDTNGELYAVGIDGILYAFR